MFQVTSTVADTIPVRVDDRPGDRRRRRRGAGRQAGRGRASPARPRRRPRGPLGRPAAFGLLIAAWATLSADQLAVATTSPCGDIRRNPSPPDSFVAPNNLAANLAARARRSSGPPSTPPNAGTRPRPTASAPPPRHDQTADALLEQSIAIHGDYLTAEVAVADSPASASGRARRRAHRGPAARQPPRPGVRAQNFTTFHNAAGHMWDREGRYDRAIGHFEAFLARVPGDAATRKAVWKRSRITEARIE